MIWHLLVAWAALGILTVAGNQKLSNDWRMDGPLTQETVGWSIAVSAGLAELSRFILLFAIVSGIGMLAQGQVPVTGRRLWANTIGQLH